MTNSAAVAKTKVIGYWTTTAVLVFAVGSGGLGKLAHLRNNVEGIVHLGYPLYVITIIAFWKALGAITLLAPDFLRLKEWAYVGIFFNMTGVAASHAVCADATWHVVVTVAFAILTVVSWALRPQSRTLGALFPGKTASP